ncbi:uncharacterized protein N0V89_001248 [Didymosphaeria variabile]|uniref:F-box domain-containing protein n=1 Tax=Didymosphaeria variabile TaxID=1932322 RepID=A0A9W9CGM2_9PLEO|nr:uncharacterized protein N0V89_001248 [Didymosphaeria variabile]KAJ4360681.1 hypothetical protein N0V89_001248 [Didymosphaeria variabile]
MSREVPESAWAVMYPENEADDNFGLNSVPEDIQHLILSELMEASPATLPSVSQSSKTLHDAALPFMYRHLQLLKAPNGNKELLVYKVLLNKFRGTAASEIARHVRSITVQNEIPSEDLMLILDKISEFGKLREFNWNTSAHIPKAVLQKLHSTWSDLEISATVVDREDAVNAAYRKMDLRLLSSPLLARLTYVVYERGYRSDQPCRSDWPKLSQALSSGGNVRSISIQSQQDSSSAYRHMLVEDTEPEKLPRLDLSLGACFSKLEQLRIRNQSYYTYLWDEEHCRALRNFIDPSRLRALDFGNDNPEVFFTTFAGILPDLKVLQFGAKRNTSLQPAKDFIDSLSGLETLEIGEAQRGFDELWPVIEKHKDTLKTLILGPTWGQYCSPEYIDLSVLETISQTFPKLERLGWHVPIGQAVSAHTFNTWTLL